MPLSRFLATPTTLTELGFDAVTAALAERCATSRGRERAQEPRFLADATAVRQSLTRIEQARTVLREEQTIPVAGADDVRVHAARAAKGAILGGDELVACGRLLRAALEVRSFLRARRLTMSELAELGTGLADFAALGARLSYALEPSGVVRDAASETLAAHRQRSRRLHTEARKRIESLLADADFAQYLQDKYFSVRSERYVLPVNASFRSKVPGIVHNASQTGQTLFIEPQALVDVGNELAIADSLAIEEEQRILAELSESVGDRADDITRAVEILADLDLVQTAARLAEEMHAEPAEVAAPNEGLELGAMRHPVLVLQKKQVVANDVRLAGAGRALVVSGPNAGGKTVSITGTGLCALMTCAGMPIPAARGSRLPLFAGISSVIGDAQDLGRDLSTFSAHLTAVGEALTRVTEGWLVLVDEIAADTDPAQGAALGRAILEELVERGARVLVTTHLDEVKALGLTDLRFVNACVGLDPATLAPTYRLELGAAGGSSAIEMAARVGLPGTVIARAREYLAGEGLLTTALSRLEVAERAAREEGELLRRERGAVVQERAEAERITTELERSRREIELRVRAELEGELRARREEVGRLIAELQAKPAMLAAQRAQGRIEEIQAEQARRVARLEAETEAGGPPTDGPIEAGAWVRVVPLGKEGRIVSVEAKTAVVEIGQLRTRARLADLVSVRAPRSTERGRARPADAVVAAPLTHPEARCDVRGMRADEALATVERFLDERYLHGPSTVVLVHGHGSGVLKQALRDALQKSPYVEQFRPGERHEGGDGATVVQLRG